ncbi:hsp70 family protein [Apiospora aurea]|uniref:Hsp70 family protein n=1 Tax=Apiospora aurea TaxID=335848 RepID=A0ABR1Q606_9PEZI
MDALIITTSVITLAEAASKLYKFLQSIRHGDPGYIALCTELKVLNSHIRAISKALRNCRQNRFVLAPIDEDVWKQSDIAIADCQRTIDELGSLKRKIGSFGVSNRLFRRVKVAAAMQTHDRDIIIFRDKIHMSTLSLQTVLQVINNSISLRNGVSQQETLRELQQLKSSLETSNHAATNPNYLVFMEKGDSYILKNLLGLVKAARGFHTAASTVATTVYAKSSHGGIPEANSSNYTESEVLSPTGSEAVPAYAKFVDMISCRKEPPAQIRPSLQFNEAPELLIPPSYPELVERYRVAETATGREEKSFGDIFSLGLERIAQRALDDLDFARAEAIFAQAISCYKVRDADDTHHSQLRIQHALCCFLQGKGIQNTEAVEDLAEFRGD